LIQKKQKIKADEKQQPFPSHSRGKIKALLKPIAQFSLLHYIHIFFLAPPSFALLMLLFFKGHCSVKEPISVLAHMNKKLG